MIENKTQAWERQKELFKNENVSILSICLDAKMACDGSSDPWDEPFLLKVKELLTARIHLWDKSLDSSRVFDTTVFLLVCETVQIINRYLS